MSKVCLITGRSLQNYVATGARVPPDFTTLDCVRCSTPVTISPSGAAKIVEHLEVGNLVWVACTPCAAVLARPGAELTMSDYAKEKLKTNEQYQKMYEFFQNRVRK